MHLFPTKSEFKDDSVLFITDDDNGITDYVFRDTINFQPTMGWLHINKDKITLLVDDRYFHGAHTSLHGKKVTTSGTQQSEIQVINVKEKLKKALEVILHLQTQGTTFIQLPETLVCSQILEILSELKAGNIKEIDIQISSVQTEEILQQAKHVLLSSKKDEEIPYNKNALYITQNTVGMWDDHFTYYLGFQPEFGALYITQESATIVLPKTLEGKRLPLDIVSQNLKTPRQQLKIEFAENFESCLQIILSSLHNTDISLSSLMTFEQLCKVVRNKGTNSLMMNRTDYNKERLFKTRGEIEHHRKAVQIIEDVFTHLEKLNKLGELKGKQEKEVVGIIQEKMKELGGEAEAFPSIVSFGKNGAVPHHIPTKTCPGDDIIEDGPLLIDIGTIYKGRISDFTRTLWVGEVTEGNSLLFECYKKIEDVLEKVHLYSVSIATPGMTVGELDAQSKKYTKELLGYERDYWVKILTELGSPKGTNIEDFIFSHGLGHGVGIRIHEYPYFSQHPRATIEKGMFITIEPGIYIPGLVGSRLENLYYMSEEGTLKTHNQIPLKYTTRNPQKKSWFGKVIQHFF